MTDRSDMTWTANRVLDGVCHLRSDRMARVLSADARGDFIAQTRGDDPHFITAGIFSTLEAAKSAA